MPGVLDGVKILDLSWGISGPVTGMLLADHGADVVKVEPPGGDPFRESPGYATWLRGRRSIELDLKDDDDRRVLHDLAGTADVVLESWSPGTAERLGADATTLLQLNPGLIVCSLSAYGDHPAHRDRPGYDALVAARLGILDEQRGHLSGAIGHMHGEEAFLEHLEIPAGMAPGAPRTGPIFTYTPWLSMGSAFLATTAISAALYARTTTGRGQHVETSLLQSAISLTASKWMRAEHNDAPYFRSWIYDRRANKGFFRCSDGRWTEQWVPNPRFVLSSSEGDRLEVDPNTGRLRDDPDRVPPDPENIVVLAHYFEPMAAAMARFPSEAWVEAAAQAGVPLQPVRTPEEALSDPALLAESAVVEVDHPEHGRLRQAGILYHLSRTPGAAGRPVPLAGQHNHEIRAEATAASFQRRPALAPPSPTSLKGPLEGVTVLDLGFAVAGPFGTQVLADLGADVIKVNGFRDPWWHAMHIAYGCNRNKRSIGIDLKTADGQAVLHRLLVGADVVHSNMRRGRSPTPPPRRGQRPGSKSADHLLPYQGFRKGSSVGLPGQRPDRAVVGGRDLRGRRDTTGWHSLLESDFFGGHGERLPLGDGRHSSSLPPGPHRGGAGRGHLDPQRRSPPGLDGVHQAGRHPTPPSRAGRAAALARPALPSIRDGGRLDLRGRGDAGSVASPRPRPGPRRMDGRSSVPKRRVAGPAPSRTRNADRGRVRRPGI